MRENKYTTEFINDNEIKTILEQTKNTSTEEINSILDKANDLKGLTPVEVAKLLNCKDKKMLSRLFEIARKIKEHIYGERIVMFAPIYVSDHCVNECKYCGFKHSNCFDRTKLNQEQIKKEVEALVKMGHKRVAFEAGEDDKNCSIDYILECIKTIYSMKLKNGNIRRANINIAATTVENYKKLLEAEIGTYILFQETYNKDKYKYYHPKGPKSNYEYHTTAFHRAMEAGIDDVGAGVLFGLYDANYEVLSLMLHNQELEKKFGVGFHTISMPRLRNAEGMDIDSKYLVEDEEFKKLVAIVRLAVPFTGMIISTRESMQMRKELLEIGISQISAGSSVDVGGYSKDIKKVNQFSVNDERNTGDVVEWVMDQNLVPSFCTACYRSGRTGDRFMQLAKSGNIKNVCLPNGLLTLKEFALDYGTPEFNEKADKLIQEHLGKIENEKIRKDTEDKLKRLENNERDLFI